MSLKDIKGKIQSVGRTRKVTKAMEAVSAVKMRKTQARALSGRPYARAALSILRHVSTALKTTGHPLTTERPVSKAALVIVTSDKGLCGVLNAAVLKESERVIRELNLPKESIDVYAFGKKAAEYFERRQYVLAGRYENVSDDVSINDVTQLSHTLTEGFTKTSYDVVYVLYTHYQSTFEQKATARRLLPLTIDALDAMVNGIHITKSATVATIHSSPAFYTTESDPTELLQVLIPRLVGVGLYHALIESKASEHSARMVAMKNATDKSKELSRSLTRKFNKVRQALITREVSEIVGGIEAMASS
ncbi:MAG: ATP synthase F1 subunit gamma [Patescibacteria group bacterium]